MKESRVPVFQRVLHFLTCGVWEEATEEWSGVKRIGVHIARLGVQVGSRFRANRCTLHAASLTFFSLMALIPVLALTLAMARAFGGADMAKQQIYRQMDSWMAEMEHEARSKSTSPVAEKVTENEETRVPAVTTPASQAEMTRQFSDQMRGIVDKLLTQLDQISFGTLGGIGAVMLLWTVISTLGKVEESFNEVWSVQKARPIQRKMCDYLFTILVLPFLMLAASTIPVAAKVTQFMTTVLGKTASGTCATLLSSGLFKTATTLFLSSLTFAFLLGFMPNAKVRIKPALIGGFVTAFLFGCWLKLCTMLQIGIAKYSALYGGFAVLPILLAWLYTSWEIILLGAEIAFAVQYHNEFLPGEDEQKESFRSRILLAMAFCFEASKAARMMDGGPLDAREFAKRRGIPYHLLRVLLERLTREKILVKVENGGEEEYLLRRCADKITLAEVIRKLVDDGISPEAAGVLRLAPGVQAFSGKLDRVLNENFSLPVADFNVEKEHHG